MSGLTGEEVSLWDMDTSLQDAGGHPRGHWLLPEMYRILEVCERWGITYMEYLEQPAEHQALMMAYCEATEKMKVVEHIEEDRRRKHEAWVSKMRGR